MIIIILSFVAAVLLIIGISIVWGAFCAIPKDHEIVLRKDYEEKQKALELALKNEEKAKKDLHDLKNELMVSKENLERTKIESDIVVNKLKEIDVRAKEQEDHAKSQIAQLEKEILDLRIESEQYKNKATEPAEKIKALEAKIADVVSKANEQANGAV